jgi:hypothetical protein
MVMVLSTLVALLCVGLALGISSVLLLVLQRLLTSVEPPAGKSSEQELV